MQVTPDIKKIAFLGDYLPRQCGIATFTHDMHLSVSSAFPDVECFVLAVTDRPEGYRYPPEVRFELPENEALAYLRAADFLNLANVDILCVQHEYGIYGGPCGSHLLALLRGARMPIVTTLHTILEKPSAEQRRVLVEITRLSSRIVTMSEHGRTFLKEIYQVPEEKIDLIPHGIPDIPFVDPNFHKDKFGVEGKFVLFTFGLLSPNKGIENVIRALPDIVKRYPDIVYIVLGATHPNLVRDQGETYRIGLERLAKSLGVGANIIFFNRFVDLEELTEFIGAADLYVTPYLNQAQITSGTLAYTFGAGKAIISTPYWHAQELLGQGDGTLVPFNDPNAIAKAVIDLRGNAPRRHAMRKRAYKAGREMIWSRSAERYMDCFDRARHNHAAFTRVSFEKQTLAAKPSLTPEIRLDHLLRMTDSTGVFQHAVFTLPNFDHGYCVDDNARALILAVLLDELGVYTPACRQLAVTCAAFVNYSYNPDTGRFRNFMGFDRRWLEDEGSEDSHARTVWALGTVVGRSRDETLRAWAIQMMDRSLDVMEGFSSPRAWAFATVGIHEYLRTLSGDRRADHVRSVLAHHLHRLYKENASEDWCWFEQSATYCNGKLPHALLLAGRWMGNAEYLEAGLKSLRWLVEVQRAPQGYFRPIGSNGFYTHGGEPAQFDQQPVEAQCTVSACLEAYRITADEYWISAARSAFDWFLGVNDLGIAPHDPKTGGCMDGLHLDRANENQGAESTLAYLLSAAEMRQMAEKISAFESAKEDIPS